MWLRTERTRIVSRVIATSSGLSSALAEDLELDLAVDRAAHLLDGLVEGQSLKRLIIEMGDDIAGADAGLGGRGIVDRRHHLDEAVFHGDLDAEPAELAAGLHLHVAEALGVHIARMRVEPIEHAADRALDQLGVVRLLDIVRPHHLENVAEQVELAVGIRCGGAGACYDMSRDGCTATRVKAAPATAPRRTREVLRIIREPLVVARCPPGCPEGDFDQKSNLCAGSRDAASSPARPMTVLHPPTRERGLQKVNRPTAITQLFDGVAWSTCH